MPMPRRRPGITLPQDRQTAVTKPKIMFGVDLGGASAQDKEKTPSDYEPPVFGARVVKAGYRVSSAQVE
jgi:hypothetical protein